MHKSGSASKHQLFSRRHTQATKQKGCTRRSWSHLQDMKTLLNFHQLLSEVYTQINKVDFCAFIPQSGPPPSGSQPSPCFKLPENPENSLPWEWNPPNSLKQEKEKLFLPPEWGGGPQSSTMPWPWRTDTVLLERVLKFSRSAGDKEKVKGWPKASPHEEHERKMVK